MLQRNVLCTPNAQRRDIAARAIVQGSATTLIYGGAHAMRPFALTAAFLSVGQSHFGTPPL